MAAEIQTLQSHQPSDFVDMPPTEPTTSDHPEASRSLAQRLLLILLPFALAHFASYVFRNVNAVVYPDLARDLSLAADNLGLLTSAYFLSFAAAQLPIGMALDRFGPRWVQVPMLCIAAGGSVLFANAQSLTDLVVARGLIGLGVAGSLMSAIKACSLWLPSDRLPLATSVLLAVGGMGAMAVTTPTEWALTHTDWRGIFRALSLGTLLVSILIFALVPEHPRKQKTGLRDMAGGVGQLYSSWSFWRLVLYTLFSHATFLAVQGLWMGPWLRDVALLSRHEAAHVLFACSIGMVAGTLGFGWVTDVLRRRGFQPILVCGLGAAIFMIFQGLMVFGAPLSAMVLAVGFTFFGAATTMNYAILAQSVPLNLTGRVSTSFNLVAFLLAFALQWGLGGIINHWTPTEGAYPVEAYQVGLGVILALQVPGFLLWLSFKPWQRTMG